MKTQSLETLERANLSPEQARAIVRAIETEIDGPGGTLLFQRDIPPLRQEIAGVRHELESKLRDLSFSMDSKLRSMNAELLSTNSKLEQVRGSLAVKIESAARDNLSYIFWGLLVVMWLTVIMLCITPHAGH